MLAAGDAGGPAQLRADPRVHRPPARSISAVHQLQREDLVQILTEPKNALVKPVPALLRLRRHRARLHRRRALGDRRQGARARDRRPRPALDHRERAARRDVRAAVAQGRLQVRDHEGDDREGSQADARHERRRRRRPPDELAEESAYRLSPASRRPVPLPAETRVRPSVMSVGSQDRRGSPRTSREVAR